MENPVGETIKFYMERFGYSPEYLGERAGVSRSAVYRHINGQVIPFDEDRDAYAKVFELTPKQFAEEVEKRAAIAGSILPKPAKPKRKAAATLKKAVGRSPRVRGGDPDE